ncbi:hypothetical protein BaRGS_00011829, partial [Batillaria attramentaria]
MRPPWQTAETIDSSGGIVATKHAANATCILLHFIADSVASFCNCHLPKSLKQIVEDVCTICVCSGGPASVGKVKRSSITEHDLSLQENECSLYL